MSLFGRAWAVTIGTLRVEAPLRVSFDVERTIRPQPNKATVKIYNLTRDHQAEIERAVNGQVIVEAGYAGDRGAEILFSGQLFRAGGGRGRGLHVASIQTASEGVDVVTHVEARDGGTAYQGARVSQSFEAGVAVGTVVRACARALGLGAGNLDDALAGVQLLAGGDTYPEGTVLSGQASRELTRLLAGLGLTWSAQHGALQVQRNSRPLGTRAVRLTPSTGLVGSPEVQTRGRVKAVSLLTSLLWPGRRVVLESERVNGTYSCEAVKYTGDSHAQPWYAECELVSVLTAAAPALGGGLEPSEIEAPEEEEAVP